MRQRRVQVEVINDVQGDLINLYRVVQHHLEEFVHQFKWALSSRQIFEWQQETRPETLTDIQRAARFYYLQHHAFGGKCSDQSFGTATTAPPINLCRIEESLSAAHLRLSGVFVEHLPWQDCMQRYDRSHTLFYCDPPYWDTEGYGMDFPWSEYVALAESMARCEGKVLLSINDHPDIRREFRAFPMFELDLLYTVGGGKSGRAASKELAICNWDAGELSSLF